MVIVYVMSEIYRHLITDGRLVAPPSMHENAKGTMIGLTAEMGILYQEQNVMMAEQINRTHPELIRRAKSKREYMYQAIFFLLKKMHTCTWLQRPVRRIEFLFYNLRSRNLRDARLRTTIHVSIASLCSRRVGAWANYI